MAPVSRPADLPDGKPDFLSACLLADQPSRWLASRLSCMPVILLASLHVVSLAGQQDDRLESWTSIKYAIMQAFHHASMPAISMAIMKS
jgi:hypothetical protein